MLSDACKAGKELAAGAKMLPLRKEPPSPVVEMPGSDDQLQSKDTKLPVKKPIVLAPENLLQPQPAALDILAAQAPPRPSGAMISQISGSVPGSSVTKNVSEQQQRNLRRRRNSKGKSLNNPKPGRDASQDPVLVPPEPAGDDKSSSDTIPSAPPQPTAPAEAFSAAAIAMELTGGNQSTLAEEVPDRAGDADETPDQKEGVIVETPGSAAEARVLEQYGLRREGDGFEALPDEARETLTFLESELDVARKRYAEVDLEKSSALLRLRNFFGLKQGISLEEIEEVRATYNEAQNKYVQARLADVGRRYAEKKGDAYKKEMADTLNLGEFEGRVKLYEARKQADIERKAGTLAGRITEKVSGYLHAYNKMKWYNKMIVGGALVGVAAAGGSVAVGAAFARGILAGGSMSVGLDAALEANADNKARKQAEEAGERLFQKIAELEEQQQINERADGGRDEEERLQAWSESIGRFSDIHLRNQPEMVTKLFEERRDAMKRRKWIIGVSGVALGVVVGKGWIGSSMRHIMDHGTGIGFIDRAFHLAGGVTDTHLETPPIAEPAGMNAPLSALNPEMIGGDAGAATSLDSSSGIGSEATGVLRAVPLSEASTQVPSGYEHFLKTASVKQGDNFWNIVKERSSSLGLDEGRSRYLIDSIKNKALSLTRAQVRELGISSGDISLVRPGDHVDFTRLFGQQDFDKYLSHAKGLSDATAQHIAEYKAGAVIDAAAAIPDTPLSSVEAVPIGGAESTVQAAVPGSGAEAVFSPEYGSRVDHWYSQIFRVENPGAGQDWVFNRSEIMKLHVRDVLKDMKAMDMGQLSGYKSGLLPEQYKNFYEFAAEMQKSGTLSMTEFLRGNVNGTVEDYLKKAAPRAITGARYGLFSTSG